MPLAALPSTIHLARRFARFTAMLAALPLFAGCASATLPTALSPPETQRWNSGRINEIVAVEPFKYPAYSDSLTSALRDTCLFAEVERVGNCKTTPTLIARVEDEDYGGVATIPIWTLLTLGIVPTVEHEGFGYHFSLRRADGSQPPAYVNYDFKSTTTLGWAALFEAMSPDVGLGSPECSDRYHGHLALAILDCIRPAHR
jgi:hypothetical protein